MKPFDLEAFKTGTPAIRRDGKKAYFGGYFPDSLIFKVLVLKGKIDKKGLYLVKEDGKYLSHVDDALDLIGMVEDTEIEQAKLDTNNRG